MSDKGYSIIRRYYWNAHSVLHGELVADEESAGSDLLGRTRVRAIPSFGPP